MNTTKPVLTKEQAKAMESIMEKIEGGSLQALGSKAKAVEFKLRRFGFVGPRSEADTISDDDFIAALYIGYEVEQTPEEKVREYFESLRVSHHCEIQPEDHKRVAVRQTLDRLGIKIEGVNA